MDIFNSTNTWGCFWCFHASYAEALYLFDFISFFLFLISTISISSNSLIVIQCLFIPDSWYHFISFLWRIGWPHLFLFYSQLCVVTIPLSLIIVDTFFLSFFFMKNRLTKIIFVTKDICFWKFPKNLLLYSPLRIS